MRVQYDVMVQEFARVLEKKGFRREDAESAACLLYTSSVNLYTSYTGRKMEDENFVAYHTRGKSFFRIKKSTFRHFGEGTLYKFKRTGRGRDTGQTS